ncbi:MAG: hypothetical protein KDC54_12095 [Lewinella sp.]|nr:hypothetical protein [Lewinella sp.]
MDQEKPNTTKKRAAPYSFRVPKERRAAFEYNLKTSGKSLSAFVTERCTGETGHRQHRAPQEKLKLLAKLLAETAAIKDALLKIERQGSVDADARRALDRAASELALIRSALMAKMGRRS